MAKKKHKKHKESILNADISIGGVSVTQKAVFAKHLAVMLKSGLTVKEAMDIAQDAAKGSFKRILKKVNRSLDGGNSLASSLAKYPKVFPRVFIDVTHAGEESGTLAENLENIALQLKKEKILISKIKSSLAYPVVVFIAAIALALGMAYYILPQVTPLFSGLNVELPITTRIVIGFSGIVQDKGLTLLLSFLGSVVFLFWLLRRKFMQPLTHGFVLHFPIVKTIVINANLSRFSLTFGTLLKSGLNIDEALAITERTLSNYYYRRAIRKVVRRLEGGSMVSENLEKHEFLFPKIASSMVKVGEESGKLDESLLYLAEFYESEVDNATKTLTTMLEPMMLIIIGVLVATIALSIITPIYEITGNIRQ